MCGRPANYAFSTTMRTRFVLLCLLAFGADAMAADATTPSTPAATLKPVVRQVVAPTISETRATRMPDGSLAFTCVDRPNPKAQVRLQTNTPHVTPDNQP
jgi:hypothetical protein